MTQNDALALISMGNNVYLTGQAGSGKTFLLNKYIKFLKQHKIFVSDIWYDSVSPECPQAVAISKTILNLPTHINVTKADALIISERINVWLKLQ